MSVNCNECEWLKDKCTLPSPHCINKDMMDKCYQKGSIDAIEEYRKEMHDMIEGNEEFTDWQKYEILECNELVAEQLKEKNNENSNMDNSNS